MGVAWVGGLIQNDQGEWFGALEILASHLVSELTFGLYVV